MKFETFDYPSGEDTSLSKSPEMPDQCICTGKAHRLACQGCETRKRFKTKLAEQHGVAPEEVVEFVPRGFCVSCQEQKPLHGSTRASFDADAYQRAPNEERIVCADCATSDDTCGC
ncbi:MAG: hypothetical protein RL150_627 [Candidatus Parcubacteria bacterium]|jgi:hypothetical protein